MTFRIVRRALPAALLAAALCACGTPAVPPAGPAATAPAAAPTTVPPAAPTAVPPPAPTAAPAAPTVAPAVLTVAPTAAPTLVPTAEPPAPTAAPPAQPTAVPPTAAIPIENDAPGPGWTFAMTGDANRDGVADAVFYWPAEAVPDVQFEDPRRAAVAVAAQEVVVVQRSAAGLETLLRVDRAGGWADQPLFDFAGRRAPAGYLLALDPAQGPLVNLLPYGAGGADLGGPIGIDWSAGEAAFRIVAERP